MPWARVQARPPPLQWETCPGSPRPREDMRQVEHAVSIKPGPGWPPLASADHEHRSLSLPALGSKASRCTTLRGHGYVTSTTAGARPSQPRDKGGLCSQLRGSLCKRLSSPCYGLHARNMAMTGRRGPRPQGVHSPAGVRGHYDKCNGRKGGSPRDTPGNLV